ncbi:MAG: discoidin domain-containing protein, partial [Nocardioides sp.]|nr:discoidin domain-containing protein [Nocardioides sp.]
GGDGGDGETATDPVGAPSSSAASGAGARDLTATATAKTPGNAPAATEVGGGRATFVAANLLDADPATAWRVAGDATGEEIVLTLPQETTITRVGLVNGYAKIAKNAAGEKFDWYHGNRTVTKAAWLFDDRTQVEQVLERDRALQSIDIDDVTTTTITLRLLQVTAPGTGRASRDFTALSDVSLSGTS